MIEKSGNGENKHEVTMRGGKGEEEGDPDTQ